jgi:hypothetical protein
MNKFIEWFTVKKLLVLSLVSTVLFFLMIQEGVFYQIYDKHIDILTGVFLYFRLSLISGITVLLPMVVLYFLPQNAFDSWKKTLPFYFSTFLLILFLVPWSIPDGFVSIGKNFFIFIFSLIYFIYSFIHIIYKFSKNREAYSRR